MRILIFIIIIFCLGCIDELDVSTERTLRVLVVEGNITTEPGPHYINLSKSAKYGTIFEDFSKKVTNAFVRIRDQEGNQIILEEVEDGKYATPSTFRAKVNFSYTLVIETNDGGRYNSIPELVSPVAQIKTLSISYRRLPSLVENIYDHGIEVYSTFDDQLDTQNYYLFKNSGTYLIETNPELHQERINGTAFPAPKSCCSVCWITEEKGDPELRVLSDRDFDGNETTQLAGFILDDGGKYDDKYLIKIHQHSLTKEAFRFFDVLKDQLAISGDLFDPPPATLRGNMIDIVDPTSPVIGYFYASDVSTDSIFLEREMLDRPFLNLSFNDDCLLYKTRFSSKSTTDRPSYW